MKSCEVHSFFVIIVVVVVLFILNSEFVDVVLGVTMMESGRENEDLKSLGTFIFYLKVCFVFVGVPTVLSL